jgi:hypothetical protein
LEAANTKAKKRRMVYQMKRSQQTLGVLEEVN